MIQRMLQELFWLTDGHRSYRWVAWLFRGRTFYVFRPSWIRWALTDDVKPLFKDS